jgi:hypothetical protein
VLRSTTNINIGEVVVSLVPINMVHMFAGNKGAPKYLLGIIPVLVRKITGFVSNLDITTSYLNGQ